MIIQAKRCSKCGLLKELDNFARASNSSDGHRGDCKECQAIYRRKHSKQQDVVVKKLRKMLNSANYRAKINNLEYNMDWEFIQTLYTEKCPILGVDLDWQTKGKVQDLSPSLDRTDPNLGYTKDNVRIVSFKANKIKNNATPIELLTIARSCAEFTGKSKEQSEEDFVPLF